VSQARFWICRALIFLIVFDCNIDLFTVLIAMCEYKEGRV
jgi:hypothetical protein